MTTSQSLWTHQQSAVITAESHDMGSFTPEFLAANNIVDANWQCQRATRAQDSVDIQFGPTHWRMTDNQLWVSAFPDSPLAEGPESELALAIIDPTRRYLEATRYMPVRRLWFYWQISAIDPHREEWMADTFLRHEWPSQLGTPTIQPTLTSRKGEIVLRMIVQNQSTYRRGQWAADSIVFENYVYRDVDLNAPEMALETHQWFERRRVVLQAINHLLEEGGPQ